MRTVTVRMRWSPENLVDETPRVLLIEEEGDLYMALRESLSSAGFDVFPAADLPKAQRYLRLFRPHVVLLDADIRHGDPVEFVESMRTPAGDLYRPVMVISRDERPTTIGRYFDLGVASFLPRPVAADAVVAKLRRIFRRQSHAEAIAGRREEIEVSTPEVDLAEATQQLVTELTPHVRQYGRQLASALRRHPTHPTGLRLTHRLRALEDALERLSDAADELELRSLTGAGATDSSSSQKSG